MTTAAPKLPATELESAAVSQVYFYTNTLLLNLAFQESVKSNFFFLID